MTNETEMQKLTRLEGAASRMAIAAIRSECSTFQQYLAALEQHQAEHQAALTRLRKLTQNLNREKAELIDEKSMSWMRST